jgi:hypothetical protein
LARATLLLLLLLTTSLLLLTGSSSNQSHQQEDHQLYAKRIELNQVLVNNPIEIRTCAK